MRRILLLLMIAIMGSGQALAEGMPAMAAAKQPATQPATPPTTQSTMQAARPVDDYALTPEQFFKRPETQARIAKDAVDIPLLEAAIFQQSNVARTANKLPVFKHAWALNLMARRHSQEMSDLQFFDHVSPTPANRTLADRLKNVGLVNVTAGENLAVLPAKEMGSGSYIIRDNPDGSETWTDEATGKRIDYYTYAELAEAVVTQWLNSPPHRANLLGKQFLFLGAAAARGPYAEKHQDSFYMTQNFSGSINGAGETKAKAQLTPPATQPGP